MKGEQTMPKLDYDDIKYFVNDLDDKEFKMLREIVYKRVENDIKEGKHNQEKTLTKTKII